MTDSPAIHAPLDPHEQVILDNLLNLRDELSLLKGDRSTYIRSSDVINIYEALIEQVHVLNDVRQNDGKPHEQNRVDSVLEDCFQLISLAFMTIGRNNEAPALYAMSSTLKRLLDHLKEAGFYSAKDLAGLDKKIESMRESLKRGKDAYSPHLITLLSNRLGVCQTTLNELIASIPRLCTALSPQYEKLVSILRSMAAANTRTNFPEAEVKGFQQELFKMQATMKDGKFTSDDGTVPENQEVVVTLLTRCLRWAEIVLERQGKVDERFSQLYDRLREIRNQLEKLELTQAWSLRETDLFSYQRQLDRVDESRVNGNFLDVEGKPADLHAQRTLLYLIRRSYAYIWGLIVSSEPVSEALLPIYNQLQTLRRCLVEVKKAGGVSSPRELYPYSMKLNSIDNMRKDGKFMVGQDIPEGQGSVNALLAECFEMAYELRLEADENNEANGHINGHPSTEIQV
ncbi:hypothetical protein MMC10_006549 [Thelotrema lepadinum]|nr:hypothetical protein [Thelotrema lepadinum]